MTSHLFLWCSSDFRRTHIPASMIPLVRWFSLTAADQQVCNALAVPRNALLQKNEITTRNLQTENWKAGFLEVFFLIFHGKLVSKKTWHHPGKTLSGLHRCETILRALHLLGWTPKSMGKNENLTHREMGIWWDKSINHQPTWCDRVWKSMVSPLFADTPKWYLCLISQRPEQCMESGLAWKRQSWVPPKGMVM